MSFRAYPPEWAEHAALRAAASRWQRRHLLTAAQLAEIEAAYPLPYYRPEGVWLWLLLFGSTYLALCTGGFTAGVLVFGLAQLTPPEGTYPLLAAFGCGVLLEVVIRQYRHYRSGVDNALLYGALAAWELYWAMWANGLDGYPHTLAHAWLLLAPTLLVQLLALYRYGDPVVAVATFGTAILLLDATAAESALGRALLPFLDMAAAGALLLTLRPMPGRANFFYYRAAYYTLRVLGLAVLYLAGNYLVVREGNALLLNHGGSSTEIPFAPMFWVFTFAVPLLYLVLALRRPDRPLLWLGLLALAFSLFTFRTYHAVLPPAVAATLAGALLTALSLGLLRYLRHPRHGLTAEADDEARPPVNLESFVQLETAYVAAPPTPSFEFGGGSSGGGGAEGKF